jgi:phospholipid/cholesterol/gamma-HCH transport system ATP-binding protein
LSFDSRTTPLVQLKNVTKRFGDRTILDGFGISIYEGETTTIIGKSGVGKSVTLKHIIGLLEPDQGDILFNGVSLKKMTRRERKAIRSQFSYMFQNNALFDSLTVFDNIALPLEERNTYTRKDIALRANSMINQLELDDVSLQYPSQLSGGMQKRVALARALITRPKIILFDEPTTGLDPIRKNAVLGMIAHYKKQFGFSAVIVSHDIPDIFFISDRIAIIYEGQAIFQGPPFELEQFDHPYTDEFVSSLVSLKDELTGLETKRSFEQQYEHEFGLVQSGEAFTVILFSIEGISVLAEPADDILTQRVMPLLGPLIERHIGGVGISSRFGPNDILSVLPHTDRKRVDTFMNELSIDLQSKEAPWHQDLSETQTRFSIRGGVAYGEPGMDLDELVGQARSHQIALLDDGGI